METFTPFASTFGGMLIEMAASALLFFHGRIAGISGIAGGLVRPTRGDSAWRLLFIGGLIAGGALMGVLTPELFAVNIQRSPLAIVIAGLLVGFGARLGSGCTSGHGVCGISRLSPRSLLATVTFMTTGFLMALVITRVFNGVL